MPCGHGTRGCPRWNAGAAASVAVELAGDGGRGAPKEWRGAQEGPLACWLVQAWVARQCAPREVYMLSYVKVSEEREGSGVDAAVPGPPVGAWE